MITSRDEAETIESRKPVGPLYHHTDQMKWAKRLSYIGVFLLLLPLALPYYWSNLSVYTESYFRHRLGPDPAISAPWVISLFCAGWGINTMLAGYVAHFIGRKWTVVIGCVLVDSGVFLSVLSVKHSLISLYLSLGLAGGLGTGLVLTIGLQHALSFPSKYPGMVTAFVTSSRFLSGACLNEFVTWYINPTNLAPDVFDGKHVYFTQAKLLDRVPSIFSVLGILYVSCQAVGLFLMRPNVEEEKEKRFDPFNYEKNIEVGEKQPQEVGEKQPENAGNRMTSSRNSIEKDEDSLIRNVSPRQMLITWRFYVLWFIIACAEYCNIVVGNYFKSYGQIWISDDQFLANTATSLVVMALVTHPLWGGFIDVYGPKYSVIALSCIVCLLSNYWYFTPMSNRWLYFVWTVAYGCISSGFYLFCPVGTLKLFGVKHFAKNFGFTNSSSVLVDFISPPIIQTLVNGCGWFYLFFSVGCMNAVVVVLAILWLPQK